MTPADPHTIDWLLQGDPAIAWQAQRDLQHVPARTVAATRRRVTREGWGARLLGLRASDGTWGGGLYTPKWTSTFYTLRLLYWFGVDGSCRPVRESCALLVDRGAQPDGSVRLWQSPSPDCCVTAMLLAMGMRFGLADDERLDAMAAWILGEQLDDGGWNCMAHRKGCRKSSFHTTLSVLEALLDYAGDDRSAHDRTRHRRVEAALAAGHAYFLRHQVHRSETTGALVKESFTRFSFPPRWYFDVLRALDHFRAARHPWDDRLHDAVELVRRRQGRDGRWRNQNPHRGLEHFRLEDPGEPSRWNTLRALRVLAWADAGGC